MRRERPTVVLASSSTALRGLAGELARHGIRLVRIEAVVPRAYPTARWLHSAPLPDDVDMVLVTSARGVSWGVEPWLKAARSAPPRALQFWSAGPLTHRRLLRLVGRYVRRAPGEGTEALLKALPPHGSRRVLYFRSREAGSSVRVELGRRGYTVDEVVCYGLGTPPPPRPADLTQLGRAVALVATSPSALTGLRKVVPAPTFRRFRQGLPLVVLGERSRRAAGGHGYRNVHMVRPASAQRFTRGLLGVLENAGA
jgi:uroporphyrinogen-III synthase